MKPEDFLNPENFDKITPDMYEELNQQIEDIWEGGCHGDCGSCESDCNDNAYPTFAKRLYAGCSKRSVAVFGEETEKQLLLEELGARGISMEGSVVRAGSYILVGSEEENLDFYRQNREEFGEKDVYLKCRALP